MKDKLPTPDEWEAIKRDSAAGPIGLLDASISAELVQAIVDAAREGVPNEACGLLAAGSYVADGGASTRYVPLRNAAESPYRYLIDPQEQLRVWLDLEDANEVPWAIVHSHVASPAVPSATDVGLAFFPDSLYVICSLAGELPTIRGWSIVDGVVTEVPLSVTE
ncbi:MAG: M67 family metallopeptidase [Candidatus Limnocylindrales bacterium]